MRGGRRLSCVLAAADKFKAKSRVGVKSKCPVLPAHSMSFGVKRCMLIAF
jgi:hypothetical protein